MFFFGDKEVSFLPGCPLRCPIKQCREHIAFRPRPQTPAEREFRKWRGCRTVAAADGTLVLCFSQCVFCPTVGSVLLVRPGRCERSRPPRPFPSHTAACCVFSPLAWTLALLALSPKQQAGLSPRIRCQNQQEEKVNKEDEAFFSK